MHVTLLYKLFFQSLVGGNTTNPTRTGCRAEHTEIYYKQTSGLTAFSPFIYLKERKSTAKAIAQPALQGTSCCGTEQLPRVKHHRGNWRGKRGGPTPFRTAAPKISHTTQMAGESNTSGAASTHSHLVPAVDSASAHQQEYSK